MDFTRLKKRLDEIILTDTVEISEYQDKYYFVKSLTQEFPEVPDKVFYAALENANSILAQPRKKKKFIDIFVESIDIE